MTMERMELLIRGNFLNLIKAELFVSASYSLSFAGAQFYVRVTVDLSGINNVRKFIVSFSDFHSNPSGATQVFSYPFLHFAP